MEEEAVSRGAEKAGGAPGEAPPLNCTAACCHGGAKMAVLAYSLGKREINQHFTVKNAKLISLVAVVLLLVFHTASRYYGGGDSCEWLLSRGRYLGENVWQPYGCMMHKYKSIEAKTCLAKKRVAFVGDSRIRQLFYAFIKVIDPERREDGNKHEDISFEDESSSVDFLWYPEANNSMKERLISWTHEASAKPDVVILGAATWSIKLHSGSSETLQQYKVNLTAIVLHLEKLADHGEVYWVLQDPVNEDVLSENRKMITNRQLELYNEAAVDVLNGSNGNGRSRVKLLAASRQAALETITQSDDGLHLPESTRNVGAMVLMNSVCNKLLRPIDGSCCQTLPPPNNLQKLSACFFLGSALVLLVLHILGKNRHRRPVPPDVESLEEKKPATAAVPLGPKAPLQALCRMGIIMGYFYLCDRADVFMKEQKFYTHSTFFIPLIYIFVLGVFYNENSKETKLLNREQTDEWKGWMQLVILIYHISGASAFLPVYMHVRVLVAAYLFQTGYGHFSFFWLKGDFGLNRVCQVLFRLNFLVLVLCVVMDRAYQFYYFVPLVTFWFAVIYATLAMWPQILQKKANSSSIWHLGVLAKLLGLLLFICVFAFSQGLFERIFSVWPFSKLFELNGSIHEWWFRWKLDRFAVIHGMLFAFIYLVLQKRQVLSEGKGETLFSAKISNVLLFLSVVCFITYSIWASSCKTKTECNEMHPFISVVQILAFILIRNIPGYARSIYSSFFAWFGKISLELFICQYHIWLAADTKGILVLIPGNPSLNIMVSTFIFVCVAHEISLITNDLAQVVIPKDSVALLKRLGAVGLLCLVILLLAKGSQSTPGA
ncbi:N-acetylneuraminate 9-O-acetyltransferase [Micropterus dolomieu]|uniref:N-acetylneuraminate 9-O-acetyltransferase n=1 Tax=Micropterus dolomieu TaxID=147949 RepID=UPI001E8EE47E|nr:N-acetylneuraminate 9-O-acetyltransferase [Micropterus dolomieu]